MAFECFLGGSPEDCAVPPKSDLAHLTQLVTPDFITSKSTRAEFAFEESGLQLHVEAHAPGVYRLRCAPPEVLQNEKPGARAKAHSEMLLARQEPVGELMTSSIADSAGQGWRLEQGDTVLTISRSPMQWALYRGEECLAQSPEGATLAHGGSSEAPQWQFAIELDGDDALHGVGQTGGELDRRGQSVV